MTGFFHVPKETLSSVITTLDHILQPDPNMDTLLTKHDPPYIHKDPVLVKKSMTIYDPATSCRQ